MAEIDNYLVGPTTPDPEQNLGTAGDFGKTFAAGTARVGSNAAGLLRYGWELGGSEAGADISAGLQKMFAASAEGIEGTINPETRKLASSAMTSAEFWEHPVLATALKGTGMLPSVAALAIPGGLMADVAGASVMAATMGSALNAGEGIDEFYQKLDAMSDKELQEQSAKYRAMRELMDEGPARARFNREAQGWGPAINAVLGAASGLVGPGGVAARGLAGGAKNAVVGAGERGVLGSAAVAAGEGAVSNALEEGVQEVTQQNAELEADLRREFDAARVANASIEGGALGGLFGGAVGVVTGGHKAATPPKIRELDTKLDKVEQVVPPPTTTDVAGPQPQTGRATAAVAKPVESPTIGNEQNEPTRGNRDGAKDSIKKKTAAPKEPPPQEATVTSDVAAAVAANEGAPVQAQATELAAMTERSPNETLDKLDQEGQPPAPPPVPAEVTPAAAPPPLDTGMNVPEQPASIAEQIAQIGQGNRKAVMVPPGTVVPASTLQGRTDLKIMRTPRGRFIFDPKLVNRSEITKLSAAGRENELLGLGPVSKPQAMADAAGGAQPVAITERTPEGVEVKAAAGTTATLPEQRASLEAQKTPGNVVAIETPQQVVAGRTGRILPNLTQTAETVPLSDFNRNKVEPPKEVKGKNYSKKEQEARDEKLSKAKLITDKHVPREDEGTYLTDPVARDRVIARAQAMLEDAKTTGVTIQTQLKKSTKGDSASDNPSMQILTEAKALAKVAAKRKTGREITEATGRFAERERSIRGGFGDEVLAERREEGDVKMRRGPKGAEETAAATEATPETELAKKEGVEVAAVEDVRADAEAGKADAVDKSGNEVKTSVQGSAKGDVRGVGDGTETTKEGVVRAKAASEVRRPQLSEEEKAKYLAMGAKIKNQAPMRAEAPLALEINRNPTPKQIEAGNYKKGHRRVEGLDYTIENPKGAIRRGDGWQVKMPADYGYIRRTTGADGEHVDAYDGRTGDRFFIIDQLDARTGEFDEHKVMMRFKDEASAIQAYYDAFSDGKGPERLGNLHEVTPAELKQWLENGDTSRSAALHFFGDDPTMAQLEPGERVGQDHIMIDGKPSKFVRSDYLQNELDRLNIERFGGVSGTLAKFFLSRWKKLATGGNHEVHYVTAKQMAHLMPSAPNAVGMHQINANGDSQVFLRDNLRDNGLEHGSLAHVLLHETAHAFTVREIRNNPAAEATIRRLMKTAADWMEHPDNAAHVEMLYGANAPGGDVTRYGFTNSREFVAEAFSNKGFQELLTQIPVNDPVLQSYLGLNRRSMSMWDMFRNFVKKAVEKVTGQMPQYDSVLDAIMKVGEGLELRHKSDFIEARAPSDGPQAFVEQDAFDMTTKAADAVARLLKSREANDSTPKNLRLRTFDNIAQIADHYFGEGNPVRRIHNAIEKQRVTGERIFQQSEPIVRKLAELRAKNREQFEEFSSLLHDATVANVHPDVPLTDAKNAHLGKNRLDSVWAKASHKPLAERYGRLSAELKDAWGQTVKHFTDRQNSLSLGIINNQVLKLLGIEDGDLAKRIHEGNLTDADKTRLGDSLETIEAASELSKILGPYVPLMRRGDHVVKGNYILKTPPSAKKISDNEFEFTTRKEAEDYAKASSLQANIKKIWIDPKTGERLGADELDSVDRYRVTVQNRHVEFIEGRRAAEARAAELAQDGSIAVHKVVPRSVEPDARQGAELSTALSRLVKKLEHSSAYQAATPTQRATLRQAIEEAALASHGSTRVSSRALPRRGVLGYSEDLVQNTVDYGQSTSRYMAKLEHAPEMERALKDMAEQLDRDHSKMGQYARTAISNEVRQRVEGENGFQQGGKLAPVVKRLLSASFTDKLASPAYSIINAMQPGMVTMPYLSARYGVGRTFAALGKAYADINSGGIIKAGAKGTVNQLKQGGGAGDLMQRVMKGLSADERAMIEYQIAHGTIDANAGMEVTDLSKSYKGAGGKADAVLGYLEGVTREMPRAIETINRSVTALAAYRLERAKGASHDAAMVKAQDAINSTQFNYSPTNSPGVFNHPLLKLALQFKKYGQGMYQLIGTQIGDAIKNAEPGDRARAVKTLIGIAATHMAMAGALGLPTEPFKYLVMAASPFTGRTWSDVENEIRSTAAALFGKTGGEVLTRGLPRLLNLDLQRMGLDSVTSFGEPRGNKEADVKSWLFDSVSGPVVSLGGDYIKGLNHLANGEVTKAAEKMIPLKAASDSIRAYRQYSEGKKSAAGKQTSEPYSPTEAGLRALGFGTARESEEGAANTAYFRQSAAQKEQRNALVNEWVQAKPTEKMRAWAAIQKFNQTASKESKITAKELTDKARRDAKAADSAVRGINPDKRSKRFLDNTEAVYNLR